MNRRWVVPALLTAHLLLFAGSGHAQDQDRPRMRPTGLQFDFGVMDPENATSEFVWGGTLHLGSVFRKSLRLASGFSTWSAESDSTHLGQSRSGTLSNTRVFADLRNEPVPLEDPPPLRRGRRRPALRIGQDPRRPGSGRRVEQHQRGLGTGRRCHHRPPVAGQRGSPPPVRLGRRQLVVHRRPGRAVGRRSAARSRSASGGGGAGRPGGRSGRRGSRTKPVRTGTPGPPGTRWWKAAWNGPPRNAARIIGGPSPDSAGRSRTSVSSTPSKSPSARPRSGSGWWVPASAVFGIGEDASLQAGVENEFARLARPVRERPGATVVITTHTDNSGARDADLTLSQRQAEAITGVLVGAGLLESQLIPVGYGQEQPVTSNASPEGRARNRRVEIHVIPDPRR